MVEGPGCKLNGEKIRASFTGQTAKQVKGNAVNKVIINVDSYSYNQGLYFFIITWYNHIFKTIHTLTLTIHVFYKFQLYIVLD